jgi:hypothetical protein
LKFIPAAQNCQSNTPKWRILANFATQEAPGPPIRKNGEKGLRQKTNAGTSIECQAAQQRAWIDVAASQKMKAEMAISGKFARRQSSPAVPSLSKVRTKQKNRNFF